MPNHLTYNKRPSSCQKMTPKAILGHFPFFEKYVKIESKNKNSFAASRFRYFFVVSPIPGSVSPLNGTNWKCDKWLKRSFRTIIYYLLGFRESRIVIVGGCWRCEIVVFPILGHFSTKNCVSPKSRDHLGLS